MFVKELECTRCGMRLPADLPQTVCPKDAGILLVRYDLDKVATQLTPSAMTSRPGTSMWRYRELLPAERPVSLGEGNTPLLPLARLGAMTRASGLLLKDEGLNPTATFKARGLSCAVSMLHQFGVQRVAIPTAGNAGSALAAYAAACGMEAHIFAPADVPKGNLAEYRFYGAQVHLVNGLISDCARLVQELSASEGWFDVSTFKEPYRVEGKKTMGYEIVEQLGWRVPDVILYPTGGGVGLVGMWKAFDEMQQLGWISAKRPRMVAVQAAGCAPVVEAWKSGSTQCAVWPNAATIAAGLRVPKPYSDYLLLKILGDSNGTAVAVEDGEILKSVRELAANEGVFASPEGAALVAAVRQLYQTGWMKSDETVVLLNTGSGLKYLDELGPNRSAAN